MRAWTSSSNRAARLHEIGRKAVHLQIALVADHETPGCIEHVDALGHVVQRRVELALLFAELLFRAPPRGNVFVSGNPSAGGHRMVFDGHGPAVVQLGRERHRLAERQRCPEVGDIGLGIAHEGAGFPAQQQQIVQGQARLQAVRRQAVKLQITAIAQDHAAVRAEHHQALADVVHRRVQLQLLLADLVLGVTPLGDVLMRGHPAAAGHRLVERLDQPAGGGLDQPGRALALVNIVDDAAIVIVGAAIQQPDLLAMPDQLAELAARLHHLRRQLVHFKEAPVKDDDLLVRIEHAHALGHVVEGRVERERLFAKLFVRFGNRLPPPARKWPLVRGLEYVRDGTEHRAAVLSFFTKRLAVTGLFRVMRATPS